MHEDSVLTWTSIPYDPVHNATYNQIRKFNNEVENALDEYLMFKYNISGEQIKNIINNTNNFKLKHSNLQKVVQGYAQYYYDEDFLFLMVNTKDFNIYKRWRYDERNI